MWIGFRKAAGLALLLALAALGLTACGSGGETTSTTVQPPPVSATTADHLAKLSDRIATDLDVGETCSAAMAADDLKAAVEQADLSARLRPGVEEVATNLVNEVNCPPPSPAPEPEKKPKKEEHGDEHGNGNGDKKSGQSDQGGFAPPGQAKNKGEQG